MSVFIRRFLSDPGNAVLTNIEAVDILDLDPPATISGVGSGTACIVGEFEDGPFNTPTEVSGSTDLQNTFGGFGFVVGGVKAQNPCARKRLADAAPAQAWNGNGYIQLAGKRFSRLIVVRVDTSCGSVSFTPTSALAADTVVPAGTTVQNSGGSHVYVTMQTLYFTQGATLGQSVKVRPATDDTTDVGVASAAITVTSASLFTVTNAASLSAAPTEAALDAAYVAAIGTTLDLNGVSHDINIIWSARESLAINAALKQNAQDASNNGCLGRTAVVRTQLNQTRANAKNSSSPGVGAFRDERTIFCYPQISVMIPSIASLGLNGGYGFTANGVIDVGADGQMASILSQLAPEENPGQATLYTANVMGIESGANAQGFLMSDYIGFRAAGIAAPRMDSGVMVFQSGVTSVDPSVHPELRNIARRRMADFIQDSLSTRLKAFGKKLNSFARRQAIASEIRSFLKDLKSENNPANARIADYSVDIKSGNTPASLALGIYRIIVSVQTLSSMDAIVLQTEIGESVDVTRTQ